MKVVLAALPAFGHVYPLVPLAIALERSGAEVVFATGDEFASRLPARAVRGAEGSWVFSDATSQIERRIDQFDETAVERLGYTLFVELCAPHVVDVMTAVLERERPDLVVFEQTNVGAATAAYATGVRAVCLAIVGWGRQWSTIYDAVATMVRAPGPARWPRSSSTHTRPSSPKARPPHRFHRWRCGRSPGRRTARRRRGSLGHGGLRGST